MSNWPLSETSRSPSAPLPDVMRTWAIAGKENVAPRNDNVF